MFTVNLLRVSSTIKSENIDDNIGSLMVKLTTEDLKDDAVPVEEVFIIDKENDNGIEI